MRGQRGSSSGLHGAVDAGGYELDVFLQKRRNKKSAIHFLTRLLGKYPVPRVIVTDKLRSYTKPINTMCSGTEHRSHKGLNNRVENATKLLERRKRYPLNSSRLDGYKIQYH